MPRESDVDLSERIRAGSAVYAVLHPPRSIRAWFRLQRLAAVGVGLSMIGLLSTGGCDLRSAGSPAQRQPVANQSASRPSFSLFAKVWIHHGFFLRFDATGHGTAAWRTYRTCPAEPPPCDTFTPGGSVYGGHATLVLADVQGRTARGYVSTSTDTEGLARGPVAVTLLPYGMARLEPSGSPAVDLCGPDFASVAPADLLQASPCVA